MPEPSTDKFVDIKKIQAKIKDLETAIAIMQKVPPNAKDFYIQAQTNLKKLETRKENLSQLLESELKVQQNFDRAKAISIATVVNISNIAKE
jgi:chromosome segregation ATPase